MVLRILLSALFVAFAPTLFAQIIHYQGQVRSSANAVLPGATVQLTGQNELRQAVSDQYGSFSFTNLQKGIYKLTVSSVGFATGEKVVDLQRGESLTETIVLTAAEQQLQAVEILGRQEREYNSTYSFSATKIATENRNIPQAISTVTKELIADRQAFRLGDVVKNVSGVSPVSFYNHYAIRGITQSSSSIENRLVNGMRTSQIYFNQPLSSNVERVEVIKGPASLTFSNTDPGGSINIITKKPLPVDRKEISLSVGSFNTLRGALDFTGPLNEQKTLLYRLNAGYEDAQSFRDLQFKKALLLAPSFSYVPNDKTQVNIELTVSHDNSRLDRGQPIFGATAGKTDLNSTPVSFAIGAPNDYNKTQEVTLMSSLTHAFSQQVSLNLSFMRQAWFEDLFEHRTSNTFAADSSSKPISTLVQMQAYQRQQKWYTNNLNAYFSFDLKTGPLNHRLVVGLDHIRFEIVRGAAQSTARGFINAAGNGVINTYNPANAALYRYTNYNGQKIPVPGVPYFDLKNPTYVIRDRGDYLFERSQILPASYQVSGLYLMDQISLGKFIANIGLRQEWYTDLANYKLDNETRVEQTKFLPRLGLTFTATKHINVYGVYTEGYQPQSITSLTNPEAGGPFDPLSSNMYELGAKTEWLNGGLTLNAAYFNITQRNILISANDPVNVNRLIQRGAENSRGMELDITGKILPSWQVNFSYAYIDARITDDVETLKGLRKENTPQNSFSFWSRYDFTAPALRGLGVGFGVNHSGEKIPWFTRDFMIPAYTLADAAVYYKVRDIQFAANINNLFNTSYWFGAINYTRLYPGTPRNTMVNVTYRF
ncbi:TonB-dependent receptor [Telluribacter sp.]|uniref:TonB-dependent receptor n=1 Tax=Telluribacter sp. TaxID=1978767 RepID=UPI002E10F17A|nr:TonB-dependent receptor [Telluribacter sp.]